MAVVAQGAQGYPGDFYRTPREKTSPTTLCTLCAPTNRPPDATTTTTKVTPDMTNGTASGDALTGIETTPDSPEGCDA